MAPDETHPAFHGEAGGTADGKGKAASHEAGLGRGAEGTSSWSMRKTIVFTQAWRAGGTSETRLSPLSAADILG